MSKNKPPHAFLARVLGCTTQNVRNIYNAQYGKNHKVFRVEKEYERALDKLEEKLRKKYAEEQEQNKGNKKS